MSPDPLIGQIIADRYLVRELLGAGGMGRVYLAEHVRMGRRSAVKVISPALAATPEAISRFNREAANASRINHPNVAQVYDFGDAPNGTLYLAMEYVEGETLDALITREGRLSVARAANITRQIADALTAAHHLEIVHRDLKPENIMIARHLDGSDWVKVVDFGIAKTVQRDGAGSQTVTTAGVSLGTPEYMSPEQLAGERLDHRTDIYSLGLVLFNMLTGQLPYPRVTSRETLVRRLVSPPRTLAEVSPDVAWPAGLQSVLDLALAPELTDRYGSVAELARDIMTVAQDARAEDPSAITTVRVVPAPVPTTRRAVSRTVPVENGAKGGAAERPAPRVLPWAIAAVALLVAAFGVGAAARARQPKRGEHYRATLPVVQQGEPRAASAPAPDSAARQDSAAPRNLAVTSQAAGNREVGRTPALARVPARAPAAVKRDSASRRPAVRSSTVGPHRWLRANGDSGAVRDLPPTASQNARISAAADEVQGHLARIREDLASSDLRRARAELAAANTEIGMLRDLYPESTVPEALQAQLRQTIRDAVAPCYRRGAQPSPDLRARCDALRRMRQRGSEGRDPTNER